MKLSTLAGFVAESPSILNAPVEAYTEFLGEYRKVGIMAMEADHRHRDIDIVVCDHASPKRSPDLTSFHGLITDPGLRDYSVHLRVVLDSPVEIGGEKWAFRDNPVHCFMVSGSGRAAFFGWADGIESKFGPAQP